MASLRSRLAVRLAFGAVTVLVLCAVAFASVPHLFSTGETLQATDLNTDFGSLDQRVTVLEQRLAALGQEAGVGALADASQAPATEPFAGTFPAVLGRGEHPIGIGGPTWFCGTYADALVDDAGTTNGNRTRLNISTNPLTFPAVVFPNEFGSIIFTRGGQVSLNLDPPWSMNSTPVLFPCPSNDMCAEPITFFSVSPQDQMLTIRAYLDDSGAVFLDGNPIVTSFMGPGPLPQFEVKGGPFALSFMSCSTDGPTVAFTIFDSFITKYNLSVDYDRAFHRNGQ